MLNIEAAEAAEETRLIRLLSTAGDRYGSVLLDFMRRYGLFALKDATADQLREYAVARGLTY